MPKMTYPLAVVLALWTASAPFAQETSRIRKPPDRNAPTPDDPQMRELFYKRLAEYLKISGDTSKRFQVVFNEYSDARGKLMKDHFELYRAISKSVEDDAVPSADLKALAQRYKINNRSLWQEREKFLKRSETILDERQMVKLLIFEDKVKEDLFRKIRPPEERPSGDSPIRPIPGAESRPPVRPR